VYEQVRHRVPLQYEDMGEHVLKNIAQPVRVWRVVLEPEDGVSSVEVGRPAAQVPGPKSKAERLKPRKSSSAYRSWVMGAGVGLVFIAGTIITVRHLFLTNPQPPTSHTQAALPLPDKPSIVVLPFTNMSGDPEQEYFSDGITEDITADLSKLSGFFVIARNSAFTYKGKAVKVQEVSREMGVRYVLEGSVRKAESGRAGAGYSAVDRRPERGPCVVGALRSASKGHFCRAR
jgi:adenylate cyclase